MFYGYVRLMLENGRQHSRRNALLFSNWSLVTTHRLASDYEVPGKIDSHTIFTD